ncbi:hypothetical protein CVT26_002787 [Gymnopilus dilepis]|uniref:Uncharacterized protein n=1 Tax=Gymnopilus dilepis TaxID=231916 RepID=A0A409Y3D4_9AGAR|nr:hypothetical protein CVT26_002787 [Gymnopilus dilepis]
MEELVCDLDVTWAPHDAKFLEIKMVPLQNPADISEKANIAWAAHGTSCNLNSTRDGSLGTSCARAESKGVLSTTYVDDQVSRRVFCIRESFFYTTEVCGRVSNGTRYRAASFHVEEGDWRDTLRLPTLTFRIFEGVRKVK